MMRWDEQTEKAIYEPPAGCERTRPTIGQLERRAAAGDREAERALDAHYDALSERGA